MAGAFIRRLQGYPEAQVAWWVRRTLQTLPHLRTDMWILLAVGVIYAFRQLNKLRGYAQQREYASFGQSR